MMRQGSNGLLAQRHSPNNCLRNCCYRLCSETCKESRALSVALRCVRFDNVRGRQSSLCSSDVDSISHLLPQTRERDGLSLKCPKIWHNTAQIAHVIGRPDSEN